MKLFILRGFETIDYTTQTYFLATSLEQARKLASELYDKVSPLINKYEKLREESRIKELEFYTKYQENVENWEASREKDLTKYKNRNDLSHAERKEFFEIVSRKKPEEVYYDEPVEISNWLMNNYWVSLIKNCIEWSEDKESTLKKWEEIYTHTTLLTDVLINDSVTDGD